VGLLVQQVHKIIESPQQLFYSRVLEPLNACSVSFPDLLRQFMVHFLRASKSKLKLSYIVVRSKA